MFELLRVLLLKLQAKRDATLQDPGSRFGKTTCSHIISRRGVQFVCRIKVAD